MSIHQKAPQFLFFGVLMVVMLGVFFIFFGLSRAQTDSVTATVQVSVCGDGEMGGEEECDGSDFGGQTCQSRGFTGGSLACSVACDSISTAGCTSSSPPPPSGGGGGGGGYITPTVTGVNLSGRAYPKSSVTVLKDAQVAATTVADSNASFQVSLTGLSAGTYLFSVYSEDKQGRRSNLLTFPVSVTSGTITTISGIFIPPTIDVDKSEVKWGENIGILGQSTPSSEISIMVSSEEDYLVKTGSDQNGLYFTNFDTAPLEVGEHFAKSKTTYQAQISSFSKAVGFRVGSRTVLKAEEKKILKGDLNGDGKVNLVDFSIVAYWYKRPEPLSKVDLNTDSKVDLIDFSIMAYYWTG